MSPSPTPPIHALCRSSLGQGLSPAGDRVGLITGRCSARRTRISIPNRVMRRSAKRAGGASTWHPEPCGLWNTATVGPIRWPPTTSCALARRQTDRTPLLRFRSLQRSLVRARLAHRLPADDSSRYRLLLGAASGFLVAQHAARGFADDGFRALAVLFALLSRLLRPTPAAPGSATTASGVTRQATVWSRRSLFDARGH